MFFDNEQWLIEQNENDKKKLENTMALYGYTESETDFFDSKAYEKLVIEFIKNKLQYISNFSLAPRTIRTIRTAANKIIIDQTGSIDRKVLYLENDSRLIYDFTAKHGELNQNNQEEFIKYITSKARKREVTNLPISWITNSQRNGFSRIYEVYSYEIDDISQYPIISTGISMINQNDDFGTTVLVHEMAHALVDRNKGIIRNILHDEVISIYLELVAAYELDPSGQLLEIEIINRLQNLKNNIITTEQQKYNGEIPSSDNYIDSCLYAFNLFEIYRKSSSKARKSVRNEINKTLSGNRLLEETLEKLNVTEEEGSKIIRKQIKKVLK